MKELRDKVAAVTGAASGIGRSLAFALAREGCHLALSDLQEAALEEVAAELRQLGVRVTVAKLDVADRAAVYAWADRVVADHGRVNLIFNNAGVALGATVEGVTYEDFEWLMNINFWGVVYGTKAFLPHLRASGEGHVINLSSVFGLVGIPTQGAYNAAKFAVRGFTESLRMELDMMRCGVSATSVHPGGIKTNIARAARLSESVAAVGADPKLAHEKMGANFRTSPDEAARVILGAVKKNLPRVLVGADAYVIDAAARLLPAGYQALVRGAAKRMM
jgi:NAD(P)-dependent dehydrogenase (short-subunit alcohol dehydrogenase family)